LGVKRGLAKLAVRSTIHQVHTLQHSNRSEHSSFPVSQRLYLNRLSVYAHPVH
jgi:hypothetical protein